MDNDYIVKKYSVLLMKLSITSEKLCFYQDIVQLSSNLVEVEESKQGVATNMVVPWYAFVLQTYHVLLSSTISTISEVIIK
jgi:hypothetical protein